MANIAPPPTYAPPVDPETQTFNPVWLQWFLQITQTLNQGGGTGLQHNSLGGLQGGTANQYYHLVASDYTTLRGGSTTDASGLHWHKTLPAGTATNAPQYFTSGTGLSTPAAGAVEYDGNKWYFTLGDATRRRVNVSDEGTADSAITVGASPFVYQNTSNYTQQVIVYGGTVSAVEFSRNGTDYYSVHVATSCCLVLGVSDRVKVTYSVAPSMRKVPL